MVQQIHSFRASGVMSSHFECAFGDARSALFRSAGNVWTVPEDIFMGWGAEIRTLIKGPKGFYPTIGHLPGRENHPNIEGYT